MKNAPSLATSQFVVISLQARLCQPKWTKVSSSVMISYTIFQNTVHVVCLFIYISHAGYWVAIGACNKCAKPRSLLAHEVLRRVLLLVRWKVGGDERLVVLVSCNQVSDDKRVVVVVRVGYLCFLSHWADSTWCGSWVASHSSFTAGLRTIYKC